MMVGDVPAAKVFSSEVLLALSERLQALTAPSGPLLPPPDGASMQDLAAFWNEEERCREELRYSCAAEWLHAAWVCLYRAMHGDLPR
jgi:hypothetical protein